MDFKRDLLFFVIQDHLDLILDSLGWSPNESASIIIVKVHRRLDKRSSRSRGKIIKSPVVAINDVIRLEYLSILGL